MRLLFYLNGLDNSNVKSESTPVKFDFCEEELELEFMKTVNRQKLKMAAACSALRLSRGISSIWRTFFGSGSATIGPALVVTERRNRPRLLFM